MYLYQPNSFVFVSRCAKSFSGQIESLFWCSCNPQRAQLVDCLPTVTSECFQSFEQQLPPCFHINAAKIVLEEVDAINDVSPTLEFTGIFKCDIVFSHIHGHYTPVTDHTYASFDLEGRWEVCCIYITYYQALRQAAT